MEDGAINWVFLAILASAAAVAYLSAFVVRRLKGWARAIAMPALWIGLTALPYIWLNPSIQAVMAHSRHVSGTIYVGMYILMTVMFFAVLAGFAVGGSLLYADRRRGNLS